MNNPPFRVGYVVKRYPRFSETFVVNEILAHEAAGHSLQIYSLYPPNDTHFQDTLARVRAPVAYLSAEGLRTADFWRALETTARVCPEFWAALPHAAGAEAREVYQAAELARRARQSGLNHLHAHFASTAAEVARLAARMAGITYSMTAHAKDIFHESVRPHDLRRKLSEASLTVTVSDFNVRHLEREFGANARRVQRVYNGLDLERFAFRIPSDQPPRIVSVGRLIEKKGFHVLIEACALLAQRSVPFACEIVGTGDMEASLRERIARHGLQSRVQMTGALPQDEVIRRVQGASVFAAPCVVGADGNADGLPTVLLEAMALGTPVVSTDVTGIPEIVRHGETGCRVAQHDAPALAASMEELLGNKPLRMTLAANARRLIEREFDAKQNAATIWRGFETASAAHRTADASSSVDSRPWIHRVESTLAHLDR